MPTDSTGNDAGKVVQLDTVRDAFASAKPHDRPSRASTGAASSSADRSGAKPPPAASDPSTWPIVPLGKSDTGFVYLDATGMLKDLKPSDHGRLHLKGLFAPYTDVLEQLWPRMGRGGKPDGPDNEAIADACMNACARKGPFKPFGRIRGRGAWLGDGGALIFHCGDRVFFGDETREPGEIGHHVYPAYEACPHPYGTPVKSNVFAKLEQTLSSWNWKRGELDARLLLGWIAVAIIAGAVKWRPVIWVTGRRGTGKSTVHDLLRMLFDGALIVVSDASAAGVWQTLGHATLPVSLDEVESEDDNRRNQSLIKFARQAASGGMILRGGASHDASKFTARSSFLFSSINTPPLQPQDRSRMAILELGELKAGKALKLNAGELAILGRQMMRRLADQWDRWDATLEKYSDALKKYGHDQRGADVFASMLAGADMLVSDEVPDEETATSFASQLDVTTLAEADDDESGDDRCKSYLLTQSLPLQGSETRRPVSEWLRRACGLEDPSEVETARAMLGRYGLKVVWKGEIGNSDFAVANCHAELSKLFANTMWQGRSDTVGGWRQALRRLSGAEASGKALYFAGATAKATLIPLTLVLFDPDPNDARAASTLWNRP